jgi:hypothetical protein
MITVKSAEFLIRLISFLIAYIVVIVPPTVFRARLARYFGDDTADQFGLCSFNPIHHIDPVGLFVNILSSFWGTPLGWGRSIFTNPFNIMGRYAKAKIALVYFSDVLGHFFMALVGIVILELMFGRNILAFVHYMVLGRDMSHLLLAQGYPTVNSLVISLGFILIAAVYLHVILGVLFTILNARDLYLVLKSDNVMSYEIDRSHISNILIPLVLLLIFAEPLRFFVVGLITYMGLLIGMLLGVH